MWLGMQRAAAAVWVTPGCMRSFSALNVGRHVCSFYCVSLTDSQGKYFFYPSHFLECVPADCVRAGKEASSWRKNSPFPNPSEVLMADCVAMFLSHMYGCSLDTTFSPCCFRPRHSDLQDLLHFVWCKETLTTRHPSQRWCNIFEPSLKTAATEDKGHTKALCEFTGVFSTAARHSLCTGKSMDQSDLQTVTLPGIPHYTAGGRGVFGLTGWSEYVVR